MENWLLLFLLLWICRESVEKQLLLAIVVLRKSCWWTTGLKNEKKAFVSVLLKAMSMSLFLLGFVRWFLRRLTVSQSFHSSGQIYDWCSSRAGILFIRRALFIFSGLGSNMMSNMAQSSIRLKFHNFPEGAVISMTSPLSFTYMHNINSTNWYYKSLNEKSWFQTTFTVSLCNYCWHTSNNVFLVKKDRVPNGPERYQCNCSMTSTL